MSSHTPGPWHANCFLVTAENGRGVTHCGLGLGKPEESEANARLIAAAPELLEALKSIENDGQHIPKAIWDLRNAVIAKAEGKAGAR
ncbi:MAG: hypothetical protein ACRD1X_14625 [Vicinamibacteria bacterium]